jgi:hypothetical protein
MFGETRKHLRSISVLCLETTLRVTKSKQMISLRKEKQKPIRSQHQRENITLISFFAAM